MASNRCKCTLGARSFICCIHHIHCVAQGGVGTLSLATKTFSARQSFAETEPHKTSYCISACRTYHTAYTRLHEDEPNRFET
jgi:hypothetical protein